MHHEELCQNRQNIACTSRREFLERSASGMGLLGLTGLLADDGLLAPSAHAASLNPMAPKNAHYDVPAKHIIQIFSSGAPSQVDTWDYKPELKKLHGTKEGNGQLMASPYEFKEHGQSGIHVPEIWPELARHIDDMAVINSMHTNIPSHSVATVMMNTGSLRLPKPSVGAWLVYGLGTENKNLPGFIALRSGGGGNSQNWRSAFLPGMYQGTAINTAATKVHEMIRNIKNPYMEVPEQRKQLDYVNMLNALQSQKLKKDDKLEAQINAYETAFSMQTEAVDTFDISKENAKTRELYGTSAAGRQMLLARRLVERGVRMIQVWAPGGWDHHNNLKDRLAQVANGIDGPIAALLADLKERGLFNETLVVWGGEFGRTPRAQDSIGDAGGRNHNSRGFSMWMAGGGVRGGQRYGETDETGAAAVTDKMHIHDLHATMMALMGFDHEKLTYRHNGRDFRLTDNFGSIAKRLIA